MNLHWCFLAVILNNIFLWLKLLSVIVSRYFCDSQSSESAWWICPWPLQPSLADVLEVCISALPLLRGDVHGLSGIIFMGYSLNKKHLNGLIKYLGTGLRLSVTTYLKDDQGKLFKLSIPDSYTENGNIDSNLPHRDIVKLNDKARNALSTVVISAQWWFNIVLAMMFGNSLNYSNQPPYF